MNNPGWSFYGSDFPTRDKLFECQQRMLEQNPDTFYILPHIATNPEDLEYPSKLFDTYKNFVVDLSARIGDLGRQPYTARKFLIKYADRILFGLDGGPDPERYFLSYRFLETDDEYFFYRFESEKIRGRWMIYGVFLPDDVLKKIYYDNTVRVLGSLK
ncbi:MAG: amidohydrolase [Treponema sp.]|nr:amidohydrolase [Treponema sp.]